MFKTSSKINLFFAENQDEYPGFWDVFYEFDVHDANEWDGDRNDHYDLFERGFKLARQAAGKLVYKWEKHFGSGYSILYFIGEEDEIVSNLNDFLEEMLEKYPLKDEETIRQEKLAKKRAEAEKKLAKAQAELEAINKQTT